jgi:hypothetical protein
MPVGLQKWLPDLWKQAGSFSGSGVANTSPLQLWQRSATVRWSQWQYSFELAQMALQAGACIIEGRALLCSAQFSLIERGSAL